jgi:hypothetical protein
VQTLTTETVQHYEWCILVQLLKHKLLPHRGNNISWKGVTMYPECERGAMWQACDLQVRPQVSASEDAQMRHMKQPSEWDKVLDGVVLPRLKKVKEGKRLSVWCSIQTAKIIYTNTAGCFIAYLMTPYWLQRSEYNYVQWTGNTWIMCWWKSTKHYNTSCLQKVRTRKTKWQSWFLHHTALGLNLLDKWHGFLLLHNQQKLNIVYAEINFRQLTTFQGHVVL